MSLNETPTLSNRAYKFRIYPTGSQKRLISKTFGCVRFIYNKMLEDKIKYYKNTGELVRLTPACYKNDFPFLKEVDSLALANAQLQLESAYNNFFRNKGTGFPKFKSKKKETCAYTTNVVKRNIYLKDQYIVLPKLRDVKIKCHRIIPNHYKLKAVTISKAASGKYFASLLYEFKKSILNIIPKKILGLDFSLPKLFVASDPSLKNDDTKLHCYKRLEDKLKIQQRKLSHMRKNSNNFLKQKRKLATIHEKIKNRRKDYLHKMSCRIANCYDMVCIEDLDMVEMSHVLNWAKSVNDASWGMFTTFLNYKLKERGKYLQKVSRMYASSKTCHICGFVNRTLTLQDRVWTCPHCGIIHNRDRNASINIEKEGFRLFNEIHG
ncbi:putative transposase [Hathewaya proteolytica DSM 3090]|uniref:Putative transposase n=1 Tax=Hathewaya proteolytica DSM 3090 TaxID=1121331 RepID=A0A1M6PRA8_9CLOT|nr:RNA-guided endonuclease TnpB family protein [Hathewaya proteolytica]SHK10480.1 putative transposase [Hathewaya proteolytica DSM 3090]